MAAGADCVAVAFAAASACLAEFVLVRTVVTLIAAFRADIRAILAKEAIIIALIICTAFAAGLAAAGARCISVAFAAASAAYTEFGIA